MKIHEHVKTKVDIKHMFTLLILISEDDSRSSSHDSSTTTGHPFCDTKSSYVFCHSFTPCHVST